MEDVVEPLVAEEVSPAAEEAQITPSGESESGYFPSFRPNRALRRWASRRAPKKRVPSAPRGAGIRVVFRPEESVTLAEELLALGALAELKRQHAALQIVYATRAPELAPLLWRRWFLAGSADGRNDGDFAALVGDDIALEFGVPDLALVDAGEQRRYDDQFQAEKRAKEEQQRVAQEKGIKDFKAQMPVYNFVPGWHKSSGFLWWFAEELGLPVVVPTRGVAPFAELSPRAQQVTVKALHRTRLADKPFVLYEFPEGENDLVLVSALDPFFPDMRLVSRAELAKRLGPGLAPLLAALRSRHCAYVIGQDPLLLTAAWAAGIPDVMELYTGDNPRWDSCQVERPFSVHWKLLPEDQKAPTLASHIYFHTGRSALGPAQL